VSLEKKIARRAAREGAARLRETRLTSSPDPQSQSYDNDQLQSLSFEILYSNSNQIKI
jgi:hypothetical protein